jgi:hypothetical protein
MVIMAFTNDLPNAARRNLEAADSIDTGNRRDVAGYLYGIAAECAIKAMMDEIGLRDDEIFYSHFPELRSLLRDKISGRRASVLLTFVNDDRFFNHWNIKMRYAHHKQIHNKWVNDWRTQAREVVNTIGTLG